MKYLLYSEKFKKNLITWILLYFFIIGLFTVVVTYSRFITSKTPGDVVKPAEFLVEISNKTICTIKNPLYKSCTLDQIRPTDYIYYYFDVDTSKMEISADLSITFTINNIDGNFGEYVLSDITDSNHVIEVSRKDDISTLKEFYSFSISEVVEANQGSKKSYELRLRYLKNSSEYFANENIITGAVSIGYSAIQK